MFKTSLYILAVSLLPTISGAETKDLDLTRFVESQSPIQLVKEEASTQQFHFKSHLGFSHFKQALREELSDDWTEPESFSLTPESGAEVFILYNSKTNTSVGLSVKISKSGTYDVTISRTIHPTNTGTKSPWSQPVLKQ